MVNRRRESAIGTVRITRGLRPRPSGSGLGHAGPLRRRHAPRVRSMTRNQHLSLDRLDRETREIAREAARQAGMTLDEWVAALIAERSGEALGAASKLDADIDAIRDRLAGRTRHKPRDVEELVAAASAESERRDREAAEKTEAALDSVARWIERAESRLDET